MATNLPYCFSTQFLEQLLKFLLNFTLLKYVKSQKSYGFLITKELIFGFQILDLKDHFSASLKVSLFVSNYKTVFSLACCSILEKMLRNCKETLSTRNHKKLRNLSTEAQPKFLKKGVYVQSFFVSEPKRIKYCFIKLCH